MSHAMYASFLLMLCWGGYVSAHVRLVYPPARFPSLDFLDNARTPPPCGVARPESGKGVRTTLLSGSQLPVSWSMAYPHQGGFRIDILDRNDKVIRLLIPQNYTKTNEPLTESHSVTLPGDFQCEDCVLRLTRQALEWGDSYIFWSCADIDITNEPPALCSGRGALENELCQCSQPFHGSQCQLYNECEKDVDCGTFGKCISTASVSSPQKVCYCLKGHFGPRCASESRIRTNLGNIDQMNYRRHDLPNNNTMYWKILNQTQEIEVALVFNSDSWISIGWKPTEKYLVEFAFLQLDPRLPIHNHNSGSSAEPEPEPQTSTRSKSVEKASKEPQPEPEGSSNFWDEHPMDATDIVIGSVKGEYHRIADYFTVSRATPEKDEFYGGNQSLTDVTGFQHQTFTVIVFRKKIQANDIADHTILDQPMTLIWAHGQNSNAFYEKDVIKYHGRTDRGSFKLNLMEEPVKKDVTSWNSSLCSGIFRDSDSGYTARWKANSTGVHWKITSPMSPSQWMAIAFSLKGIMADADIILATVEKNGRLVINDYNSDGYSTPRKDKQQDIHNARTSARNQMAQMRFTREYSTGDSDDWSFGDKCLYVLFPVGGGSVRNGRIGKHFNTPQLSENKLCLQTCGQTQNSPLPVIDLPKLPIIRNIQNKPIGLPKLPTQPKNTTEDWRSKYTEFVDECATDGSMLRTHWSGFTVGDCRTSPSQLRRCRRQCQIWQPGTDFGPIVTQECRTAKSQTKYRCFCQYRKARASICVISISSPSKS